MGFYLHIEVDSTLSPHKFRELEIEQFGETLKREPLGRIFDADDEDDATREGHYESALEVTDQGRAKEIVEAVLKSVAG